MDKSAKKLRQPKGQFPNGETLCDIGGKKWKLGDVIGQGGFGRHIYLASDKLSVKVGPTAEYVVKTGLIEHEKDPLLVEMDFYQSVNMPAQVDSWRTSHELEYLGVPKYISSGHHSYKGKFYRFMVMQRFGTDLQKLFENANKVFPRQTVYALALRIIDALEYLHVRKYVHANIKAANCLLGYHNGKITPDNVYVVDYGLATTFFIDGKKREYKEDPTKAHNGTIEFTSIDAHKGVAGSRRGDLQILGYCLLQWLCSRLPWEDKLTDPNYVMQSKIEHMGNIPAFMKKCFPEGDSPGEIATYLTSVMKLQYDKTPNYKTLRNIFHKGLDKLKVEDSWKLALPLTGKPASTVKATKRKMDEQSTLEPQAKTSASNASAAKVQLAKSPEPQTPSCVQPGTSKGTYGAASVPVKRKMKRTKFTTELIEIEDSTKFTTEVIKIEDSL